MARRRKDKIERPRVRKPQDRRLDDDIVFETEIPEEWSIGGPKEVATKERDEGA
jgi:hypothetical protein